MNELITCPHCGYEDEDSWEYRESHIEYTCPCCCEESNLHVRVEITRTATKKDDDLRERIEVTKRLIERHKDEPEEYLRWSTILSEEQALLDQLLAKGGE